jgi:protein-S-isoprenylcysteine O-methyltransferase Ste14
MTIAALVGSGDRIAAAALPFAVVGVAANVWRPSAFAVGGPPALLAAVSAVVLAAGIVLWIWSAALILIRVPRRELITSGPYALVKHPLYTSMALLILPWLGLLLDSWLGATLGGVLYVAARRYSPAEERALARTFGASWDAYAAGVKLPWL